MRSLISFTIFLTVAAGLARAQASRSAPPTADAVQYAPDRDYDLIHVSVDLTLDYQHREFHGVVVHTLASLRDDIKAIKLDCGRNVRVESCEIAGRKSPYSQSGEILIVTPAQPLLPGKATTVLVRYSGGQEVGRQRGFHWLTPTPAEPERVGFWTLGEPQLNRARRVVGFQQRRAQIKRPERGRKDPNISLENGSASCHVSPFGHRRPFRHSNVELARGPAHVCGSEGKGGTDRRRNNWGDVWLNEGFATFFQKLYFEHSRGQAAYDHEVQGLFNDSFSATRPLASRTYPDAIAMFDNSTYAKGAAILHCLRRTLGDKAFFAGIHHYLVKYRHQPVDSHDFCSAMTEETGINLERFFDQWVYRPGHPVIDYAWKWDKADKQIRLTVAQMQTTGDGTPIYDMNMDVGIITGAEVRERIRVDLANQELQVRSDRRPDAVLLDPNHDFPIAVLHLHWAESELPFILKYAPNAVDRERAMAGMLQGSPSDSAVRAVADAIQADVGGAPVFQSIASLGKLGREDLRPLFRGQMNHADINRRAEAIFALGLLPKSDADAAILRDLVNDQQPYVVVRASLITLGKWDPFGNKDVFEKATTMRSPYQRVRLAAYDALRQAAIAEGKQPVDPDPKTTELVRETLSAWANGNAANPKGDPTLRYWLKNLKSLSFTMRDDVRDKGMVRVGSPIAYVYYYKLVTESEAWYIGFSVTADGKIVSHLRF